MCDSGKVCELQRTRSEKLETLLGQLDSGEIAAMEARIVTKYRVSRDELEDLHQEAAMNLLSFDFVIKSPMGLYWKSLLHVSKSHRRKADRLPALMDDEDKPPSPESSSDFLDVCDFSEWFDEALCELPPQHRSAFTKRFAEGMEVQQIAKELSMSPGNVSKLVQKAAVKLDRALTTFRESKDALVRRAADWWPRPDGPS